MSDPKRLLKETAKQQYSSGQIKASSSMHAKAIGLSGVGFAIIGRVTCVVFVCVHVSLQGLRFC
jgi:hypothetical protein